MQRHDIFKKRLDVHGNVIEAKQDGIGAPKVSNLQICFLFHLDVMIYGESRH